MSPTLQRVRSPFGRCEGAHSHQAIHSRLEKRERAQSATLPLRVSLDGVGPYLPSPQTPFHPLAYPCYTPIPAWVGCTLRLTLTKKRTLSPDTMEELTVSKASSPRLSSCVSEASSMSHLR